MVTDGKERSWSDTWINCSKHPHRAFPHSGEARPGEGFSRQNARVRKERPSTRRYYGTEEAHEAWTGYALVRSMLSPVAPSPLLLVP